MCNWWQNYPFKVLICILIRSKTLARVQTGISLGLKRYLGLSAIWKALDLHLMTSLNVLANIISVAADIHKQEVSAFLLPAISFRKTLKNELPSETVIFFPDSHVFLIQFIFTTWTQTSAEEVTQCPCFDFCTAILVISSELLLGMNYYKTFDFLPFKSLVSLCF